MCMAREYGKEVDLFPQAEGDCCIDLVIAPSECRCIYELDVSLRGVAPVGEAVVPFLIVEASMPCRPECQRVHFGKSIL